MMRLNDILGSLNSREQERFREECKKICKESQPTIDINKFLDLHPSQVQPNNLLQLKRAFPLMPAKVRDMFNNAIIVGFEYPILVMKSLNSMELADQKEIASLVGTGEIQGRTILHSMCMKNSPSLKDLKYILDLGVNPNQLDQNGSSPLNYLITGPGAPWGLFNEDWVETVKYLINSMKKTQPQNHAIDTADNNGRTPLGNLCGTLNENQSILKGFPSTIQAGLDAIDLLMQAGAKTEKPLKLIKSMKDGNEKVFLLLAFPQPSEKKELSSSEHKRPPAYVEPEARRVTPPSQPTEVKKVPVEIRVEQLETRVTELEKQLAEALKVIKDLTSSQREQKSVQADMTVSQRDQKSTQAARSVDAPPDNREQTAKSPWVSNSQNLVSSQRDQTSAQSVGSAGLYARSAEVKTGDFSNLLKKTVNMLIELDKKTSTVLKAAANEFARTALQPKNQQPGTFGWANSYLALNDENNEAYKKKYRTENLTVNMTQRLIEDILNPISGYPAIERGGDSKEFSHLGHIDFGKCREVAQKIPNEYKLEHLKNLQYDLHAYIKVYQEKSDPTSILLKQCKSQVDAEINKLEPDFRPNVSPW